MRLIIIAEKDNISIRTQKEVEFTRKDYADLLLLLTKFIGRLAALIEMPAERIESTRNNLGMLFIGIMGGAKAAGYGPLYVEKPITLLFDTGSGDVRFIKRLEDSSPDEGKKLPDHPMNALLLVFSLLSECLAGDIDHVFFASDIAEAFSRGVEEYRKEKEAEDGKIS